MSEPIRRRLVPACPKCSQPMVLRVAKTGYYSGQKFYGCSMYPICTGIVKYQEFAEFQHPAMVRMNAMFVASTKKLVERWEQALEISLEELAA